MIICKSIAIRSPYTAPLNTLEGIHSKTLIKRNEYIIANKQPKNRCINHSTQIIPPAHPIRNLGVSNDKIPVIFSTPITKSKKTVAKKPPIRDNCNFFIRLFFILSFHKHLYLDFCLPFKSVPYPTL